MYIFLQAEWHKDTIDMMIYLYSLIYISELTNGLVGHGSNESPDTDGSHGSWVSICDVLTHE